jgi:large subunit ribosomal protein L25
MAESLVLNVQIRQTRGKRNARRLRQAGLIPAVLYGHGEETLALSVPAEELDAAVRHGSRLFQLAGEVKQQAFVREVQWNTWGTHVVHADFARVSAHEKVEVDVPVELRGEAPGVKEGGIIEHALHQIEVECEATAIPEKIQVNINNLNLDDAVTAADLELPAGVRLLTDPESLVVQCVMPAAEAEEVEGEAEAEPEIIGRKKEEQEGADES